MKSGAVVEVPNTYNESPLDVSFPDNYNLNTRSGLENNAHFNQK